VSIYPVDPSVTPVDASGTDDPGSSDAARALASQTDGQAIRSDIDASLGRAAADAAAYYVLTYRAPHAEDGRFHEIQVRVKRPGVKLRARKGYWAPSPDDTLRASLLERLNAPPVPRPVEPPRHVSTLIRPWFGLARGVDGKTRVTIVWEPAARVPGDRTRRDPRQIVLTALDSNGTVLFEGPLLPTGPAVLDEPGGTPARAVFDALPGRLRLRMSIQDAASQVLDSDVRDFAVPDFRRGIVIGTPEILRARNAREFRLLDGGAAIPVASREFSRTERLLIRFPAYGPSDVTPVLTAKLLSRMGQSIRDLTVSPAAGGGLNEVDLPLASLAAGEYMIEVTATSSAGEARDRVAFRVTS
jgi:hypothetical protein